MCEPRISHAYRLLSSPGDGILPIFRIPEAGRERQSGMFNFFFCYCIALAMGMQLLCFFRKYAYDDIRMARHTLELY